MFDQDSQPSDVSEEVEEVRMLIRTDNYEEEHRLNDRMLKSLAEDMDLQLLDD